MENELVECIIFRKIGSSYQFLLLKRVENKGSFWQPVSGAVEQEDNSKLEAAYREIFEETRIDRENMVRVMENVHHFTFDKHYITGKPIEELEEFVFGFEVNAEVEVDIENNIDKEHEDYQWVSYERALELLKWEDNKEALKKLASKLET